MGYMEMAMEEVDYNLALVNTYLESYVDRSLADSFFEADEEAEASNNRVVTTLQKVFAKLKEIVESIAKALKNFFDYAFMSKEEKERYNELKRKIKEDKELANTHVTVEDFRVYEKIYDEALKEAAEAAKKDNFDEDKARSIEQNMDAALKKAKENSAKFLKKSAEQAAKGAKRAAMSLTLTGAVDLADNCELAARAMKTALDNEIVTLESFEKELGNRRMKRVKKDIDSAAKNSIFHRLKVRILKRKCNDMSDLAKKEKKRLLSFTNLTDDGKMKAGAKLPVSPDSVNKGMLKFQNRQVFKDTNDLNGPEKTGEYAKKYADLAIASAKGQARAKRDKKAWEDAKAFFKKKS